MAAAAMTKEPVGVIYFNVGTAHLARLVVSLLSLRRHYGGPVTVLDAGGSEGIVSRIATDQRLGVDVKPITIKQFRRHSAYCAKASLWRHSPYDTTIYLDADTLIVRPIHPLLDITCDPKNPGFVVTRFADWISTGAIVSERIKQWRRVECRGLDVARLVRQSLDVPHPAINTGVLAWRRGDAGETLGRWEKLTQAGWKCSFTDELSAQVLIRQEPHTLLADRFNCSPIYGSEKDKAVVMHGHGRKHLTRADGRGSEADKIWSPLFTEAFAGNVGGLADWAPAGDATLAHNLGRFKRAA